MSQEALAQIVGVSRSAVAQWEGGMSAPTLDKIATISLALGSTAEWILSGEDTTSGATEHPKLDGRPLDMNSRIRVPAIASMPVDLPELGTAVGGNNGDFSLNGQVIDYKRRPPGLAANRSAFAIRLLGESMTPRFEEGELLYIDPNRHPKVGDYVLIELKPERGGEPGNAYIKRLLAKTPTKLRLGQFNPPKENIEVPLDRVLRVSTVLQLADLLGV